MKKGKILLVAILLLAMNMLSLVLCGCSISNGNDEKIADVDFTVVDEVNLVQEIKDVIEEKKAEAFRVIFSEDENMYIVVGYGEQKTSGYSIAVDELYLTKDSIHINTSLIGPSKGETINDEPTYPYVVVMIENTDYPVVFD